LVVAGAGRRGGRIRLAAGALPAASGAPGGPRAAPPRRGGGRGAGGVPARLSPSARVPGRGTVLYLALSDRRGGLPRPAAVGALGGRNPRCRRRDALRSVRPFAGRECVEAAAGGVAAGSPEPADARGARAARVGGAGV